MTMLHFSHFDQCKLTRKLISIFNCDDGFPVLILSCYHTGNIVPNDKKLIERLQHSQKIQQVVCFQINSNLQLVPFGRTTNLKFAFEDCLICWVIWDDGFCYNQPSTNRMHQNADITNKCALVPFGR